MRSTFFGLELVRSGIQSAQTGLDVTGQNIAKKSNKGYSRQVIEQSAVYYSTKSYKYALTNSDNIGQGVTIDHIAQVRDQFLDARYRTANSEHSALSKMLSVLENINNIYDETLNDNLGATFEKFYVNLQTLSLNTGDIEYSGLVRSSAQKITESLNYYNKQLNTITEQEEFDLSISVADINTLLTKIDKLNSSIQYETILGNTTNELLDTRNLYLDELSGYINITTENNTDGTVNVKVGDEYLIDAENAAVNNVSVQKSGEEIKIVTGSGELDVISGSLRGYLETFNGKGTYASGTESDFKGVPFYKNLLDDFASSFAKVMNDLNGDGKPLFYGDTAAAIEISDEWLNDANFITTTTDADVSDGKNDNILKMIHTLDSDTEITDKFTGTFDEYITMMMTEVGIDEDYISDITDTANTVLTSVDNQRESVKGVSLNEETVNLIKYQKAFEASARVMTALDELLDVVINRMGVVGR